MLRRQIERNLNWRIDFSSMSLKDQDIGDIFGYLERCTTLCELNLSNNPGITDCSHRALLQIMEQNAGLVRLGLRGTGLSPSISRDLQRVTSVRAVDAALRIISSDWHPPMVTGQLEVLLLNDQDLFDQDIRILYNPLLQSAQVRKLDLGNNMRLTDDSGVLLLDVVNSNRAWMNIEMENTSISANLQHQIAAALKSNALQFAKSLLMGNIGGITTLDILKNRNVEDGDIILLCQLIARN